jgi:hypothetical protein
MARPDHRQQGDINAGPIYACRNRRVDSAEAKAAHVSEVHRFMAARNISPLDTFATAAERR